MMKLGCLVFISLALGACALGSHSMSSRSKRLSLQSDFQWPLKEMEVTSHFGKRKKGYHEGVDLKAVPGTAVFAAQKGVVLYAASKIRGYGKMVVLRHSPVLTSIYAHNSKIMVQPGKKVSKGEIIAYTGETGRARGPHLHFEIRNGLIAVNPFDYMPKINVNPNQQKKIPSPRMLAFKAENHHVRVSRAPHLMKTASTSLNPYRYARPVNLPTKG